MHWETKKFVWLASYNATVVWNWNNISKVSLYWVEGGVGVDLTALNAYIRKERFRMISAFTWKKLIMTVEVKQKTLTIGKFNYIKFKWTGGRFFPFSPQYLLYLQNMLSINGDSIFLTVYINCTILDSSLTLFSLLVHIQSNEEYY